MGYKYVRKVMYEITILSLLVGKVKCFVETNGAGHDGEIFN